MNRIWGGWYDIESYSTSIKITRTPNVWRRTSNGWKRLLPSLHKELTGALALMNVTCPYLPLLFERPSLFDSVCRIELSCWSEECQSLFLFWESTLCCKVVLWFRIPFLKVASSEKVLVLFWQSEWWLLILDRAVSETVEEEPQVSGDVDNQSKDRRWS